MNQEENSPQSQGNESQQNGLEQSQNEEMKEIEPEEREQPIAQGEAVQPEKNEALQIKKGNEEKLNSPELAVPPNNIQGQGKQKVKVTNNEAKKTEGTTKIRKKIKKSKSYSSFSEQSFTSNMKQKKRKGRKPNDPKKAAQSANKPEGKRRGRQKSVAPKIAIENKESKTLQEQLSKIQQKAIQRNTSGNKRAVTQPNRNEISLANMHMHWNNQKPGEIDFDSVDAEICQESCNQRVNNQFNRKIMEAIEVQGQNIIKKIAELPIIFY